MKESKREFKCFQKISVFCFSSIFLIYFKQMVFFYTTELVGCVERVETEHKFKMSYLKISLKFDVNIFVFI